MLTPAVRAIARYTLASIAGLLTYFAIIFALNPPVGEFFGGAALCGTPFVWLALVAVPSSWFGEQVFLDSTRIPRRYVWPIMGLIYFSATFLPCNWLMAFLPRGEGGAPYSEVLVVILIYAAINMVSGLAFWAALTATRRWTISRS